MTTVDYLNQLTQDRDDLVDNLEAKGITGLTGNETFTELVPEVLNISGGGGVPDWSQIGYSETPQALINNFNYSKEIYDNWDSSITDMYGKFMNDTSLIYMPLVDTSNVTTMYNAFNKCENLVNVPLLNTSNVTNMQSAFGYCSMLKEVPLLDTSKVTNMRSMFIGCVRLTTIPLLDTSNVTNIDTMFTDCANLTDTSLNNILQMCINAIAYNGTKTLAYIGFNSTKYPASRIQALPKYQDFIDAGWTIGY